MTDITETTRLSPPPSMFPNDLPAPFLRWFEQIFHRVGSGPFKITGYSKLALPTAADWGVSTTLNSFTSLIYVPDEVGGSTLAYSDGTNWRRVSDNAIVA